MLDLHPVFSLQKLKVSCNEVIIMSPVFLILARLQSNSPKRLSEGEKPSRRSCHRTSAFIRTCANVIRITPYRPFANDRLSPEEFDWTQCFPPAWLSFSKHKRETLLVNWRVGEFKWEASLVLLLRQVCEFILLSSESESLVGCV